MGRTSHRPSAPPDGYPDDLPFLPGLGARWIEFSEGRSRMLSWRDVSDMDRVMGRIAADLAEMGWVERSSTGRLGGLFGTVREYGKGDRSRRLIGARFPGQLARVRLVEKSRPNMTDQSVNLTSEGS
jgi:hypothetical protein